MVFGEDLLVASKVKVLDRESTLNHDIVMVVSPGQCMACLDLGTRRHGMISGVGTFGQAGTYRPVSSPSSLRSHDSDQVGYVIYSPTHETGPAVLLESRV